MHYINRKDRSTKILETVDMCEKRRDALAHLREYQMDRSGEYYLSSRACKEWADDMKAADAARE